MDAKSPDDPFAAETERQEDPHLPGGKLYRQYPTLVWEDDAGPHEIHVKKRVLMGSAEHADVTIAAFGVSRLHCELNLREDGLWVSDLESTNGTFVENVRVASARVHDGARLRVGSAQVVVQFHSPPVEVALWPQNHYGPLVGRSTAMRELFSRMDQVARHSEPVLILGETGTGKELIARAIHNASARRTKPYIVVDCAALHGELFESELFGHQRGAFTGAINTRAGAFEVADGGTVFLDEIGELPLESQAKLLRTVELGAVRRLGETEYRTFDVRVIAATHRDLPALANTGGFREDLFFRLCIFPLVVPSLRERPEDIPLLVERLLPDSTQPFSPEVIRQLCHRPWPGNVRELRTFVRRAVAIGANEALGMPGLHEDTAPRATRGLPAADASTPFKLLRGYWLDHLERSYLSQLIDKHGRDMRVIAEEAELDTTYVYRLAKKHDL